MGLNGELSADPEYEPTGNQMLSHFLGIVGQDQDQFGGLWKYVVENDEYKEFTCGETTIDRDMYENMPSPMDTSSLTDENMQRLAEKCKGQDKLLRELNDKTVYPITAQYNKVIESHSVSTEVDEDALRKEFEDYGTFSFFTDED